MIHLHVAVISKLTMNLHSLNQMHSETKSNTKQKKNVENQNTNSIWRENKTILVPIIFTWN